MEGGKVGTTEGGVNVLMSARCIYIVKQERIQQYVEFTKYS